MYKPLSWYNLGSLLVHFQFNLIIISSSSWYHFGKLWYHFNYTLQPVLTLYQCSISA